MKSVEFGSAEVAKTGMSQPSSDRNSEGDVCSHHPKLRSSVPSGKSGLSSTELRRRLWHMAPGFLPFFLWPIPHRDPISPILLGIITLIVISLAIAITVRFYLIAREEEKSSLGAVLGYASAVLVTFWSFPAHPELGMTVLAILAFGDGWATMGGLLLDGRTLPWNREKTWSGTLSFLLVASPMSSIIYWGEAQPSVAFSTALICGSTATIVAAFAESLPSRINDNFRVGYSALVTVAIVHGLVVGWS